MIDSLFGMLDWLTAFAQYVIIPGGVTFALVSKLWATFTSNVEAVKWFDLGKFTIQMIATGAIGFVALGVIRDLVLALGTTAQSSIGF